MSALSSVSRVLDWLGTVYAWGSLAVRAVPSSQMELLLGTVYRMLEVGTDELDGSFVPLRPGTRDEAGPSAAGGPDRQRRQQPSDQEDATECEQADRKGKLPPVLAA